MEASARREPERTCVGCRSRAAKADLVRFVRTSAGSVELDRSGHAQGRGAYVHHDPECVRRAVRTGSIARSLRVGLSEQETARLVLELGRGVES